jgi:hypothetical protein
MAADCKEGDQSLRLPESGDIYKIAQCCNREDYNKRTTKLFHASICYICFCTLENEFGLLCRSVLPSSFMQDDKSKNVRKKSKAIPVTGRGGL